MLSLAVQTYSRYRFFFAEFKMDKYNRQFREIAISLSRCTDVNAKRDRILDAVARQIADTYIAAAAASDPDVGLYSRTAIIESTKGRSVSRE